MKHSSNTIEVDMMFSNFHVRLAQYKLLWEKVATEKKTGGEKNKREKNKREKTDGNSGNYVIASSWPPERRPLERHTLAQVSDII